MKKRMRVLVVVAFAALFLAGSKGLTQWGRRVAERDYIAACDGWNKAAYVTDRDHAYFLNTWWMPDAVTAMSNRSVNALMHQVEAIPPYVRAYLVLKLADFADEAILWIDGAFFLLVALVWGVVWFCSGRPRGGTVTVADPSAVEILPNGDIVIHVRRLRP